MQVQQNPFSATIYSGEIKKSEAIPIQKTTLLPQMQEASGELKNKVTKIKKDPAILDFVEFLKNSPTAWQATDNMMKKLTEVGFTRLKENEKWDVEPGKGYFVERNGSSLIAFQMPDEKMTHATIMAAHTDSPALKLKPNPEVVVNNMLLLSPEVYGWPVLPTWENRDLTLAGVIYYLDKEGKRQRLSVNLEKTIATIAELAIHLDREKGKKTDLNPSKHLLAYVGTDLGEEKTKGYVSKRIEKKYEVWPLEGSELFLVPNEAPTVWGDGNISSYRQDNLSGCHSSLSAFLNSLGTPSSGHLKMVVFTNHEEIGSRTHEGAMSPFLKDNLKRLQQNLGAEEKIIFKNNSLIVANDVAHAFNPNYSDKYDSNHRLYFKKGIAIKSNANQHYATNASTQGILETIFTKHEVAKQYFSADNGVGCGTTDGPINAAVTGIPSIDVGELVLTMHGAREIGHCKDHLQVIEALTHIFRDREKLD